MALAEIPQPIDPREVQRPYETILELTFGGDAVFFGDQFLLWASTHFEPGLPFRSMMLFVTTDMKILVGKNQQFDSKKFDGNIRPFPIRISHNPKRNTLFVGEDYEINFRGASGLPISLFGNLSLRIGSAKPIPQPEPSPIKLGFAEELKKRRNRANSSTVVLP